MKFQIPPKYGTPEFEKFFENKALFLYESHPKLNKAVAAGKALDGGLKRGRFNVEQWLKWFDIQSLQSQGIQDRF